jgi:hypothetical protein
MRTLLLVLTTLTFTLPVAAQEMLELPNDPNLPPPPRPPVQVHGVDESDPYFVPTLPAPSPSVPVPPPVIVPRPHMLVMSLDNPADYHQEPNRNLTLAGGLTLGAAWVINVVTAVSGGANGYLAIPLAGPFVRMGLSERDAVLDSLLAIDALVEIGGLAMTIVGATTHRYVFGRKVQIVPTVLPSGAGASVTLRL